MIKKIHHIGIVVKNLDDTMKVYTQTLGKGPENIAGLPGGKIRIANTVMSIHASPTPHTSLVVQCLSFMNFLILFFIVLSALW